MNKVKTRGKRTEKIYAAVHGDLHTKIQKLCTACHFPYATMSYLAAEFIFSSQENFDQSQKVIQQLDQSIKQIGLGNNRLFEHRVFVTKRIYDLYLTIKKHTGIDVATLHYYVLEYAFNNPYFINKMQDEFNRIPEYKILPVLDSGRVTYVARNSS